MFGSSSMKFAVVGLGLFGKRLARELASLDHQVLAIDRDEAPVSEVQDVVNKAVVANVKQDGLMEELVTSDFEAVIVTMATDLEANLLSVLQAQEIDVDTIIAKSHGPKHTTILKSIGVNRIISPEEDVAKQVAEQIGNPDIDEYLQFDGDHGLVKMAVPEFFVGQELKDLNLRNEYGAQIIGIRYSGSEAVDYVPDPSHTFNQSDVVWVTGPKDKLETLAEK